MTLCHFVSDMHGRAGRYHQLLRLAEEERPAAVFLGGDLLPAALVVGDFLSRFLIPAFSDLRRKLGGEYPRVFLIPGNDDSRAVETDLQAAEADGLWEYLHGRRTMLGDHPVYGYACVPPTPFRLKDWERYDVSRFVDPGSVAPEEGWHSVPFDKRELRRTTMAAELDRLTADHDLDKAVLLFHAPPYRTKLDRAGLDGRTVDHAPLDVHIGSIAVRRLIESRQPLLTLHGHVHESARLTGAWMDRIGRTFCLSAAHDGPELALVRFDLDRPGDATRELL